MPSAVTSVSRPYGGIEATARLAARRGQLLAAGLDLLGADQQVVTELTVRGVCRQAGVTARYFYESFTDKEQFIGEVFDWVIGDLAAATQSAVTSAPAGEKTRTGMANLVATIAGDVRIGRLLFSVHLANAVLVRKRSESSALFAMLSGQYVGNAMRMAENDRIKVAAHFVVGGVGQTISAWLAGQVRLDADELVDQLASLLDELADPALYRD